MAETGKNWRVVFPVVVGVPAVGGTLFLGCSCGRGVTEVDMLSLVLSRRNAMVVAMAVVVATYTGPAG